MISPDWLTIGEAAQKAGCSPRTMRRRLNSLNRLSGGTLLRANSDAAIVRKWWISRAVLEELLAKKRAERQGVTDFRAELDRLDGAAKETDSRVDDLAMKGEALNRRLRNQWKEIKKLSSRTECNERAIEALRKVASALSEVSEAIAGVGRPGPG